MPNDATARLGPVLDDSFGRYPDAIAAAMTAL
jgi:hypothetical protein